MVIIFRKEMKQMRALLLISLFLTIPVMPSDLIINFARRTYNLMDSSRTKIILLSGTLLTLVQFLRKNSSNKTIKFTLLKRSPASNNLKELEYLDETPITRLSRSYTI